MPIVNIEQLRGRMHGIIGDRNDDEALSLLEDIDDTFATLIDDTRPTREELEAAVAAVESEWRNRYRARFETGSDPLPSGGAPIENVDEPPGNEASDDEKTTFEELFKEENV